ncbi:MAG: hypothetical protein M0R66_04370 [Candidatus Omnitrophica bacterium]|jgi:hypothetical protein|nr:hypothetical protein [Candidatus Omnitrophota bacterium]
MMAEIRRTCSAAPWIWLYEGTLAQNPDPTPSPTFYLTSTDHVVTWAEQEFLPYPLIHEDLEANSAGELPTCRLKLSNVTREFSRYLWLGKGMIGQTVTIRLVHSALLEVAEAKIEWTWEVRAATVTSEGIVLSLELPNYFDVASPTGIYARDRCSFRYKDPETCGYVGDLTFCDKTIFGAAGCQAHGLDEAAAGRPIRHPRINRAFPGIPPVQR